MSFVWLAPRGSASRPQISPSKIRLCARVVEGWPAKVGHRKTELGPARPPNCPKRPFAAARELWPARRSRALSRGPGWRAMNRLDLIGPADQPTTRPCGPSRAGQDPPSRCKRWSFVAVGRSAGASGSSEQRQGISSSALAAGLEPEVGQRRPLSISLLQPLWRCWLHFTGKTALVAAA